MQRIDIYLKMIRPANLLTAIADILAGIAISGYFTTELFSAGTIVLLSISTVGLYGGGIVFNDVFDLEIDKIERPERPLPKGLLTLTSAILLGTCMLLVGIFSAFLVSLTSGVIAFSIALAAMFYNKVSKHHHFFGPLNMGICRGLNLLLGISIVPSALPDLFYLGVIPIVYIYSITMVSHGEVHGGSRNKLFAGVFLFSLVIGVILGFSYAQQTVFETIPFLCLLGFMIFKPLIQAIKNPSGRNIGKAVKAGVISVILMDAAWTSAFASVWIAAAIALMLPLSLWLGKRFAVT